MADSNITTVPNAPVGAGIEPPVATPSGAGTVKPKPVPKLPTSQFQTAQKPEIPIEPLEMPGGKVTPEYCLTNMARVLEEFAEKQQEPEWCQQHIELANAWLAAAQALMDHAVQGHQILGDQHLKQQQADQQHDLHMQTLAQNDQQHSQKMKQADDQHQQSLKHNDMMNKTKIQQTADQHKVNLDTTKKKADFQLKQQQQKAQQAQIKK